MMYGLTDKQLVQIRQVLSRTPRLERAILFGSRAKGTNHPGSDVDLALFGESFALRDRFRLDNDLDDLDLPFTFDLLLYDQLTNPALRDHIDRVGVTLYEQTS
ncbi:nucleotidyltransferase domain-containing protein [Spirosoma rhododendri]|uniref:Nucleotidyltransferase domain-containing protein n=1 Tax=Spirosoma rhododendri TaxID=2728024 RepID=A0A7L5DHM2_9BACT|nr:nucleotidyltransferase domain-containing protein [Spirosoma rhododendri]QJD77515.1 nucleotidyltransferase domain-containing protein [Spirosoma rhododendri]